MHAIWIDPNNSDHVIIGNDGGLDESYDWREDLELLRQRAGRTVLSRQLRHVDAVQRLRRHAGQLRLVRPERRCANSSGIYNHDWFQMQGGDGFVVDPGSCATRGIIYSESQDGNMIAQEQSHGRVEEHSADRRRT